MKKTGEILRKAREEKGLSLHEVGIFLKINTRILQAIEEGQVEKLPAKTFLRGFIQSYAKYLKLDANHVLKVFSDELRPPKTEAEILIEETAKESVETVAAEPTPEPEVILPEKSETEEKKSSESTLFINSSVSSDSIKQKMLIVSVLGFLLVFVVYIGNNLIRRYQKEASVNSDVPVAADESPEEAMSTPVAEAPPLDLNLNNQNSTPAPLTFDKKQDTLSAPAPSAPSPVVEKVVPPSTPPPTTTTTTTPPATAQTSSNTTVVSPTPTTGSTTEKKVPEGKPIEVIVEAKENVEIEYSSARSAPQKLLLKGEQIHTFKSRSGVRLKISNGGAVNVIVNGQDLGAPGAQGQSVQLNYE